MSYQIGKLQVYTSSDYMYNYLCTHHIKIYDDLFFKGIQIFDIDCFDMDKLSLYVSYKANLDFVLLCHYKDYDDENNDENEENNCCDNNQSDAKFTLSRFKKPRIIKK